MGSQGSLTSHSRAEFKLLRVSRYVSGGSTESSLEGEDHHKCARETTLRNRPLRASSFPGLPGADLERSSAIRHQKGLMRTSKSSLGLAAFVEAENSQPGFFI